MDRQRIINLFAAISTITVFGFALGLMFPLLALIMEERGIDPDIIGYNTAMQPLGIMLSVFTTPILVRKFGAKRATIGAAFATGTVILIYPFLSVFWWWFALRILHGFFVSTLFAISEAWIVKFAAGPYRSRILALYTSVLAASFGGGPVLISFTGIDTILPFVIGALVLAIATIPIFFVKDENIEGEDEDPLSVIGFIRKAPILLIAVGMFAVIDAAGECRDALRRLTEALGREHRERSSAMEQLAHAGVEFGDDGGCRTLARRGIPVGARRIEVDLELGLRTAGAHDHACTVDEVDAQDVARRKLAEAIDEVVDAVDLEGADPFR